MGKKMNKFEEFSCELKNESSCDEELNEEGTDIEMATREHFVDDE